MIDSLPASFSSTRTLIERAPDLIHVAEFNLGILMRALFGRGTPREAADARNALFVII
ncbi:MAG: hypothetical protein ACXW16_07225 [Burkholderiaceae bacterium]